MTADRDPVSDILAAALQSAANRKGLSKKAGDPPPEGGSNARQSANGSGSGRHLGSSGLERTTIMLSNDLMRDHMQVSAVLASSARDGRLDLFERDGVYVQVERRDQEYLLAPVTPAAMQVLLAEIIDFRKQGSQSPFGGGGRVYPPKEIVHGLLDAPGKVAPPVRYVTEIPPLHADGSIAGDKGYDKATMTYYVPSRHLRDARLAYDPSPKGVAKAVAVVDDLLADFPFADAASRANTFALLCEPVARPFFSGPSPLYAIDAPTPAAGKTLLARAVLFPGLGYAPSTRALPRDETEMGKALLAILLAGHRAVILDNANSSVVRSDAFEALLTSGAYQGRLLGQSKEVRAPNLTTWVLTGNNVQFGGAMARRAVLIRLDPKVEEAWERHGFRHDPLLPWVEEHLATLTGAVLSLVGAWLSAGRPKAAQAHAVMGSFESWQDVMGGILHVAGIEGFLANRAEMMRSLDPELDDWRALCAAWWERYPNVEVTAPVIASLAAQLGVLGRVLRNGNGDDPATAARMGRALRQMAGRVVDGHVVSLRRDSHTKNLLYCLAPQEAAEDAGAGGGGGPA